MKTRVSLRYFDNDCKHFVDISHTLLARNSVKTVCVRRISLPENWVKLTCSKQYLSIYFFMIFGYGINYGMDIWWCLLGVMYSRVHNLDKSNFIFDCGLQLSPDFKKWGCQNNFCLEGELMSSSTFQVSKTFFQSFSKLTIQIARESKMKQKLYKNNILKIMGHQVEIWKMSKIRTDNLLTRQINWNIFWSIGQKLLKISMKA